jgi:hypothetical protein
MNNSGNIIRASSFKLKKQYEEECDRLEAKLYNNLLEDLIKNDDYISRYKQYYIDNNIDFKFVTVNSVLNDFTTAVSVEELIQNVNYFHICKLLKKEWFKSNKCNNKMKSPDFIDIELEEKGSNNKCYSFIFDYDVCEHTKYTINDAYYDIDTGCKIFLEIRRPCTCGSTECILKFTDNVWDPYVFDIDSKELPEYEFYCC